MSKSKTKIGCLLIHGWTSSPQELEALKNHLIGKGIQVSTPILPGHGTRPEHLNEVSWQDWISESEKELEKLRQSVDKIFVGGVSLGGNIAFLLAHKNHIDGIISMGTPIYLNWERAARVGLAIINLTGFSKRLIKKWYPADMDTNILTQKSQYWEFPAKSAGDVFKIISESKKVLPGIKAPALIMQSKNDHVVKPGTAEFIYKELPSTQKDLVIIDRSYHVFIIDQNKEPLFEKIHQFIEKTANENRDLH
jgi:carboxylesterase